LLRVVVGREVVCVGPRHAAWDGGAVVTEGSHDIRLRADECPERAELVS
jgi:hypothetical protein